MIKVQRPTSLLHTLIWLSTHTQNSNSHMVGNPVTNTGHVLTIQTGLFYQIEVFHSIGFILGDLIHDLKSVDIMDWIYKYK